MADAWSAIRCAGVRAIWRRRSTGVNPPPPPVAGPTARLRRIPAQTLSPSRLIRLSALFVAALYSLAAPLPVRGLPSEPLTIWLDGVLESTQALAERDPGRAEKAARIALAAVPRGEASARAQLSLAFALSHSERFADAARAFQDVSPYVHDPALAKQAHFHHADALLRSGHPGAAAIRFAQIADGEGLLAQRARWSEADALFAAGSSKLAVMAYRKLVTENPSSSAAPKARLSLGMALRAAGEEALATSTLRSLWVEQPAHPAAREAEALLDSWRAAGSHIPNPSAEEQLARAIRLLELALPRHALSALEPLRTASPSNTETSTAARMVQAMALLQLGRREEAEALARRMEGDAAATPGSRAGAELILARVASRAGRVEEAAARYRRLASSKVEIPGLSRGQARDLPDDAEFLSAWLYYDVGAYRQAASLLRAYARAHPRDRRAADARWFEAWSLYRLGDKSAARRALSRFSAGPRAPAAFYWQARLASNPADARQLYRRVMRLAPSGSWYALIATNRLRALGAPPPPFPFAPPAPIPEGGNGGPGGSALSRAVALASVGLTTNALTELRALASSREGRPAVAQIAQLAAALGDSEIPFRVARDSLAPSRRALRWAYPMVLPDLVGPATSQTGVDPLLYLALMRRESAFNPEVRSSAGAVGMVQLIPPTAARLATVLGIPGKVDGQLQSPLVSIPMGAVYLALLSDRFTDPAVVLAAYNAGPAAASTWARARAGLPLDEWVETIPFRETRRYVQTVSADRAVYGALWRGTPLEIDVSRKVPEPREGVAF